MIIQIYVIVLYIYSYDIKKFEHFNIFLACNNWTMLLKKIEKKYLALSNIASLYQRIGENSVVEIARHFLIYEYKFKVEGLDT